MRFQKLFCVAEAFEFKHIFSVFVNTQILDSVAFFQVTGLRDRYRSCTTTFHLSSTFTFSFQNLPKLCHGSIIVFSFDMAIDALHMSNRTTIYIYIYI